MLKIELIVEGLEEELRVDKYIANNYDEVSRSELKYYFDEEKIYVNSKLAKPSLKVINGDVIEINERDDQIIDLDKENIPLEVVYEDSDVIVVNKPSGMVVHPAPGHYSGTLVNALLYHCDTLSNVGGDSRAGIVHRIDKDTSGLLMVAKNDYAHNFLAEQIKEHSFFREYAAICYGNIKNDSGVINAPIARHPQKRKQMAIVEGGREAITHYEVAERLNGFTYLRLRLETGRTHQIRVHTASIGHPVAGDSVYGPKKVITELNGQCLHAKKLGFIHPDTKKYMEFDSELPSYFTGFLERKR